jgi:hypothetical protein
MGSATIKKKYTQEWSSYNKAQTNEKSPFLAFLYQLCSKIEEPIKSDAGAVSRSRLQMCYLR